jgi:betaine-aldehyde dehydrogenase
MQNIDAILPTHRGLFYGGAWRSAQSGGTCETHNPALGQSLGAVEQADASDVDIAVHAAVAGFAEWRVLTPLARARILKEAAAIVRANARELGLLDSANTGNPVREMALDVEASATSLEYFAGLATELKGATHPMGPGSLNYTIREPLGVVVRIGAYNHPFLFAAMKIGAPLAAGNSVIVKPPEQAPLSTLRLAELIGHLFPAGVFSVLPGGRACGEALSTHPLVAKVGVIGAVSTGQNVYRSGAQTLKKLSLELGGKNAMIAFPDADLDKLVNGVVRGMNFTWCGQSCGSTSRLFLHDSIHDEVLARVVDAVERIRPGIPTDPATEMGCLISKAQLEKVQSYVDIARAEGARLMTGGRRPNDPALSGGFFFLPTVFADVRSDMRITREEVFGPILSVIRWSDREQMMREVNGTDLGLTASIWTRDLVTAHQTASAVQAGFVWVNQASSHFLGAPFGGYKMSGIGREESIDELFESSQIKNVNIALS